MSEENQPVNKCTKCGWLMPPVVAVFARQEHSGLDAPPHFHLLIKCPQCGEAYDQCSDDFAVFEDFELVEQDTSAETSAIDALLARMRDQGTPSN